MESRDPLDWQPVPPRVFPCAVCGSPAAEIRLIRHGRRTVVQVSGFMGVCETSVGDSELPEIRRLLATGSAREVRATLPRQCGFYCVLCGQPDCANHWETQGVYHDGGWEHEERGRCPQGHEQVLAR